MVVGRMVMAEKEGVPKRVTLASIVYELVLGFGTAVMVGAYFVIQLPELEHQPARYAVLLADPDRARVPPPARLQAAHRLRSPQARAGAAPQGAVLRAGAEVLAHVHRLLGGDRRGRVRVRQGAPAAAGLRLPLRRRGIPGGVLRGRAHLHRAERPGHARRRAGRGPRRRAGRDGGHGHRRRLPHLPDADRAGVCGPGRAAGPARPRQPGRERRGLGAPRRARSAATARVRRAGRSRGWPRRPDPAWVRPAGFTAGGALRGRVVQARVEALVVGPRSASLSSALVRAPGRSSSRRPSSVLLPVDAYLPKKGENCGRLGGLGEGLAVGRRARRSCSRARSSPGRCRRPPRCRARCVISTSAFG